MSDQLIDISDPAAFQTGIFKDLVQGQAGLWRYAENVMFLDGSVEKANGWSLSVVTDEPVNAITQAYVSPENRKYLGTTTKLLLEVGGVVTELGAGYTETEHWAMDVWGSWLIASNRIDNILIWKNSGADTATDLGGIADVDDPPPAFTVVGKSNQQFLGYWGQTLYFSSKSNPEDWVSTDVNEAGSLFIRDLDSDVVAAKPLGAVFLVYSRNTMLVQEYTGSPSYFGFPSAPIHGIGALSAESIVPIANKQLGVCLKGFFETDGLTFDYIDRPMVNRWFTEQIDPDRVQFTHGVHWEQNTTVRWTFICKDGQRRGLDYNYLTKAWTIHTLPLTASDGQKVFPYPVVAEDTSVGLLGQANDRGGTLLSADLLTFPFDGGTKTRYKNWDWFRFQAEYSGAFQFRLGFHDTFSEEPDWIDWVDFVEDYWLEYPRSSVFVTVEFRSTTVGTSWRLGVLQAFGSLGGML